MPCAPVRHLKHILPCALTIKAFVRDYVKLDIHAEYFAVVPSNSTAKRPLGLVLSRGSEEPAKGFIHRSHLVITKEFRYV